MGKYEEQLRKIQKARDDAKARHDARHTLISFLSTLLLFILLFPLSIVVLIVVIIVEPSAGWIIAGVIVLIICVIFGLDYWSEKIYERDIEENEEVKRNAFQSILTEEERDIRWDHMFTRYFNAEALSPLAKDLGLISEVLNIFLSESDGDKKDEIYDFLEQRLEQVTDTIETDIIGDEMTRESIAEFTEELVAFYKDLYKKTDVIEVNTKVLETLAALDGLYDPYGEVLHQRD